MRRLLTLLLIAVAALSATAQPLHVQGLSNNQRVLGYTLTDDIDINGATFSSAGTYTIGAALPPESLAPYAGCRLVGIRVAAALNLGRTRTFIYNFTGETFDLTVEQKQRIYEGWNNVLFNGDGYEIRGDETLFFGYDYVETQEMVDAEEGGMACVGEYTDGSFYIYGDYGQGEGLYPISGAGRLCVQLIVDVSNLPQYDMAITYLDTGFKHKKPGDVVEVLANFSNVGRDTISSYQLGYQIDTETPVLIDRDETVTEGQTASWLGNIPLPDDITTGIHSLAVFIGSINGEPVTNDKAKRLGAQFAIYRDSLPRNEVYFEVYTDAASPYSAMLNDAIKYMEKHNSQVAVVNVHRPDTPLAIDASAYLCDLYAYTYPTFTINRAYFPGDDHVAYDMNYYLPLFGTEMSGGILSDMVLQDLYSPSFASISLSGSYDETTRQLTINAQGELLPEAKAIYGDIALTLMLTEDGVKSRQAVYNAATQRTTYNQSYEHQHVLRDYMTAATGDVLNTEGNSFSAQFTTTLDTAWDESQMGVVALLSKATDNVTQDDLLDMDIINTASIAVRELRQQQGITTLTSDDTAPTPACYTLDGKKTMPHQLRQGIYVVRSKEGRVQKICVR